MTSPLFTILKKLDDAGVYYSLHRCQPDAVDIHATFVGCRAEISVFEDGRADVSRFCGNEDVEELAVLDGLIAEHESDK